LTREECRGLGWRVRPAE